MPRKLPPKTPLSPSQRKGRLKNLRETANKSIELLPIALPTPLLEEILRYHAESLKAVGAHVDQFYGQGARRIVESCIRLPVNDPAADPFLEVEGTPGQEWRYSARIMSIAHSLWVLRDIDGFDDLCRRLREMDLRIAASELYAVELFHVAGYRVTVRPETDTKGEDFDFSAAKDGATVNVEVTTIGTASYRAKTVTNKLNAEHDQLPPDAPGVIALDVPQSWYEGFDGDLNQQIALDSVPFLVNCGRVNAVIILSQKYITHARDPVRGSTGVLDFSHAILRNPLARNPDETLDAFFDGTFVHKLAPPTDKPALDYRQDSDMFDWLDKFWYGPRS